MTAQSISRRRVVAASAAALTVPLAAAAPSPRFERALSDIEAATGGRIGVAALNTANGAWLRHRADERFAMCSTFKALLVGHVLSLVDAGGLTLDHRVPFTRADLLSYAPRARAQVAEGTMSVADLCAAAVEVSDNTAANLLLAASGGPAGLTEWLRRVGDEVTRLDRNEPGLNTNLPGDPRDTTTPRAFAETLRRLLLGPVLASTSRARLTGWMVNCETGRERLRAGVPAGWRVADKTGTGDRGAVNDVAVLWPPGSPPIVIAAMMSGSGGSVADLGAAQARIARAVVSGFA